MGEKINVYVNFVGETAEIAPFGRHRHNLNFNGIINLR
jgi:hypothetical protein